LELSSVRDVIAEQFGQGRMGMGSPMRVSRIARALVVARPYSDGKSKEAVSLPYLGYGLPFDGFMSFSMPSDQLNRAGLVPRTR
jgi:hypothetical protein